MTKAFGISLILSALQLAAQAATFDVRAYGALGDGIHDDSPAINNAVAAARGAGAGSVVYLPAGTYFLSSGADAYTHINLFGSTNLTIQGESRTNTMLLSGNARKRWFLVQNCTNVVIRELSMDAALLGFTQGTVTSRDPAANTCVVTIDDGYDSPNRPDFATNALPFRVFTDTNSQSWNQNWIPGITARQQLTTNRWRFTLSQTPLAECVGKKVLLWPNLGGQWGFDIIYSSDMLIENVSWYGGGWGNAFALNNCGGTVTLRRLYVGAPPGSNRLLAGQGCSQGTTRGSLVMEDCDISRVDDDGINQLSPLDHVLAKVAPATLQVPDGSQWLVGDEVSLWDWTYQQQHERDRATVVQAVHNADRTWTLALDHDVTIINVGSGPADRAGQERDGIDRLCNLNKVGTATIRNCRFSDSRARAILIKSQNALIEGCTIYDSHYGLMAGTETYWSEGPQLRNLTIRSNLFQTIDTPALDIGIFYSQASRDCTNVLIEGNTFLNNGSHQANGPRGVGLRVRNANGAVIRNNVFDGHANANIIVQDSWNVQVLNNLFRRTHQTNLNLVGNYGVDPACVVWVDACTNVTLAGNLVTNMGPTGSRLVTVTATATSASGVANGVFLADESFILVSGLSGLALEGAGAVGTSVTQQARTNRPAQQFKLNPVGNGYSTLVCIANGLNLGLNAITNSGAALVLESPSNADDQLWRLTPSGADGVQVINKASSLAASVLTSAPGEVVVQRAADGSASRQWFFLTAPSGLAASAGDRQVSLAWKAVSGATNYPVDSLKKDTEGF